jgi:hypothetical protein
VTKEGVSIITVVLYVLLHTASGKEKIDTNDVLLAF